MMISNTGDSCYYTYGMDFFIPRYQFTLDNYHHHERQEYLLDLKRYWEDRYEIKFKCGYLESILRTPVKEPVFREGWKKKQLASYFPYLHSGNNDVYKLPEYVTISTKFLREYFPFGLTTLPRMEDSLERIKKFNVSLNISIDDLQMKVLR